MTLSSKIQEYVNKAQKNFDLPGLAVGISKRNEEAIYLSGMKDVLTGEPLNKDTVFHFASISKLFVSTAIMKLYEESKLSLDMKITDIIPWFRMNDKRYENMKLWQILSHSAGFPDIDDYHWDDPKVDSRALKRYMRSDEVTGGKLLWDPGSDKFQYSNIGYEVLGQVISSVSNFGFEEYIRNNILNPLEMKDSTFLTFRRTDKGASLDTEKADHTLIMEALDLDAMLKKNMAIPHTKDENNNIIRTEFYPYNRTHAPSSTLTSTVSDIFKWGRAHLEKKIMNENSYREAWTEIVTVPNNGEKMGLGWFKRVQQDHVLYGHEGSDEGFRSSFWICPELDTQIIVLSNISRAPVKKINRTVFEMLSELGDG